MTAIILLLLLVAEPAVISREPSTRRSIVAQSKTKDKAQVQALVGHNELHQGRLSEAQMNCDSALMLDPANETAKDCLDLLTGMLIDQELNQADARLLSNDRSGAIALASKWINAGARPEQQARAWRILNSARSRKPKDIFETMVPDWLRQVLFIGGLAMLLFIARKLWREWQRGKWYGKLAKKTRWSMIPLKEISPTSDVQTGMPTDAVLDALARIGPELQRELWKPKLLLLRPTPPANYEPAVISGFLSNTLPTIALVPAAGDLHLEWELHDVELDKAVQSLQLRTATGIDIGSVARFIRSVLQWFNTGAPTISGIAQTGDKGVSIHLAAHGGRTNSVAITASTDFAPGIDPTQLSAERAAFKFLFRMRYPEMTNDEIDGFSALRQGVAEFTEYAGTVPGIGEDARRRKSSLAKAALNLSFFRASIPLHTNICSPERPSLNITDDVRQSVLLAEGVAHSLICEEQDRVFAIDCFRQLQDWPGCSQTEPLRLQAAYNEAIVWRQLHYPGHCVLQLTELLGERTADTISSTRANAAVPASPPRELPDAIRFPARLARLAAFAEYDRDIWNLLPKSRLELLINDAENLVKDLNDVCESSTSAHDHRLARYMYIETLRSISHIELLRVITGVARDLYHDHRPVGLLNATLIEEGATLLERAIKSWMLTCEQLAPSCGLYCDLAEAYLLLSDFGTAQGYARHATLEATQKEDPENERAYYIATESFFLQGRKDVATTYAEAFKGSVTLQQFKSVRTDLGIF
ncbi:MAG: hypothetical protein JWO13_423 [Acidobacteriales bacterium]|nr:hypothetical protein [Terriglobales bacterium]